MGKFVLVFKGGSIPQTEEEQKQVMDAWTAWFGGLGDSVVDMGNPFGASAAVGGGGTSGLTGYSIVNADSLDDAVDDADQDLSLTSATGARLLVRATASSNETRLLRGEIVDLEGQGVVSCCCAGTLAMPQRSDLERALSVSVLGVLERGARGRRDAEPARSGLCAPRPTVASGVTRCLILPLTWCYCRAGRVPVVPDRVMTSRRGDPSRRP